MESFIQFFADLSSAQKFLWIVLCMSVFWVLEGAFPLAQHQYEKWKHAKVNLVLLTTTIIINVLFGLLAAGVFIWGENNSIGLLYMVEWPLWLELLLGVMLLDLIAQYTVHYLLHKVKFMWKFHMVHHSDTEVDVTTGTRHHPGDYLFRELFALIAIVLGGIPFGVYMVYRIITIICTYWTHSNLNMPQGLDKFLSYLFITPNMHKFHHHFERPWTDTNFGNIFSLWDRAFGTFVYDDPSKIKYGLDVADNSKSNDLEYQLKLPFDKSIKTDY
jgi:sterol desaturase/sphingolipid hydroxylase (fatty acid hydroxylase superfamily)